MVNVGFAKNEYLELIADFEKEYFGNEAYSINALNEMLKDNYLLKDNDNIFIISDNDCLIGYIIFHINYDFTDIYKIFIIESLRNNGYGKLLIDKVVEIANRYNSKKLLIEVRSNNLAAINFYKHNQFNEISIRKNYYKNPNDDALIFERRLV